MLLRQPSDAAVEAFLRAESRLPFSYAEVGATGGTPPSSGYKVDDYGVKLGRGEAVYDRARAAIDAWKVYPPSWFRVYPDGDAAPRPDLVFVTRIHHLGLWSLNSCRVIETWDERGVTRARHGFSFGTLPGHEEQGEERFSLIWDLATGDVHYKVLAFSRPRGSLARLGTPVARWLQGRFARETCETMVAAARG